MVKLIEKLLNILLKTSFVVLDLYSSTSIEVVDRLFQSIGFLRTVQFKCWLSESKILKFDHKILPTY